VPPLEQSSLSNLPEGHNSVDPIDQARELLKVAFEETKPVESSTIPGKFVTDNTMPQFGHQKSRQKPTDPITPLIGGNALSLSEPANPDDNDNNMPKRPPQAPSRPTSLEASVLPPTLELDEVMGKVAASVIAARNDFSLAA
jgi:hypothetical protein